MKYIIIPTRIQFESHTSDARYNRFEKLLYRSHTKKSPFKSGVLKQLQGFWILIDVLGNSNLGIWASGHNSKNISQAGNDW